MDLSSREYKLMLDTDRFVGDVETCRPKVSDFWADICEKLGCEVDAKGKLDVLKPKKQRDVFFLDTEGTDLYRLSNLVFRMRRPRGSDGPWSATLKFRHGDRLLAAAQTFHSGDHEDIKFEEDVKAMPPAGTPRFWALFSRSVEAEFDDEAEPATVGDCLKPYEDFGRISLPPRNADVFRVGALRIREHVFEGGLLKLSEDVSAECALILWWKEKSHPNPVAAEFSFRFDLEDGEASAGAVRNAWTAMTILCASPWVDPKGPTKTALVYGSAEV